NHFLITGEGCLSYELFESEKPSGFLTQRLVSQFSQGDEQLGRESCSPELRQRLTGELATFINQPVPQWSLRRRGHFQHHLLRGAVFSERHWPQCVMGPEVQP